MCEVGRVALFREPVPPSDTPSTHCSESPPSFFSHLPPHPPLSFHLAAAARVPDAPSAKTQMCPTGCRKETAATAENASLHTARGLAPRDAECIAAQRAARGVPPRLPAPRRHHLRARHRRLIAGCTAAAVTAAAAAAAADTAAPPPPPRRRPGTPRRPRTPPAHPATLPWGLNNGSRSWCPDFFLGCYINASTAATKRGDISAQYDTIA